VLLHGDKERRYEVLEHCGEVTGISRLHGLLKVSSDGRVARFVDKGRLGKLINTGMSILQYEVSAEASNGTLVLAQQEEHKKRIS